jgi:hypothetical protein
MSNVFRRTSESDTESTETSSSISSGNEDGESEVDLEGNERDDRMEVEEKDILEVDETTLVEEVLEEREKQPEEATNKIIGSSKSKAPMWNGERLFPPKRRINNPSRAWQHGGFRKDRTGQLETKFTICGMCGKEQIYRSTPSNLAQHLTNEHSAQFAKDEEETTVKSTKVNDYFAPLQKKSVIKYKRDHPKQKLFQNKLVEWVVTNGRPLKIIEDEKLIEAFEIADEKLKIPSRQTMKREVEQLYKKKKAETTKELEGVEWGTETNDAGSSSGAKSFIDVNFHWVTENFEPKKKILTVMEMKEAKNATNYRKKVDEIEEDFKVKEKVFLRTTDNEATMRKAFSDDERNGCYAHIASKSHKKALESQSVLKKLRIKLKKIAKKSNKSSKFKYLLAKKQKEKGLRIMTLKQEVKTRFTSVMTCFHSFLNDPNEKNENPMDEEKVSENIDAINEAMVAAKINKEELAKLTIKPEDVRKLKAVLKVIDSIEEDITLLGGETYSTGSAVLPVLNKLNKRLEPDEDDPIYVGLLKRDILEDMQKRCIKNLNKTVLAKASFFDMRFSKLRFLDDETKADIIELVEKELLELEKMTAVSDQDEEKKTKVPEKKKRFLGNGLSDSEDDNSEGAKAELERYKMEKKIKSDSCPFVWWRSRKAEYPMMSRLARKYLAVQATSTAAERVMSRLGIILEKRRQAMTGELFNMLMFLSDAF